MAANPIFSSKDNAVSLLSAGISASSTTVPLASGKGALYPQPQNGTCTSTGTSTTLNCTGIGSKASVGKFIFNYTDNSIALVTAVSTNSVTTTRLLGGSTNLWNNADAWRIDEFVVTLLTLDASNNITKSEEARIYDRSTDNLLCASASDRGYNGTTAQSWLTTDYADLLVTSPYTERIKDYLYQLASLADSHTTSINNLNVGAPFYAADSGAANAYLVSLTPNPGAYSAGLIVHFKATNANTGVSTLNVNALGLKTIKKVDGATDLAANDIRAGQLVSCVYDGTNFQMLSLLGNIPPTLQYTAKTVYASGASSTTLTNPTTDTSFDTHTYAVPSSDIVAGVGYEFECGYSYAWGAGNLQISVQLGSTVIVRVVVTPIASPGTGFFRGTIMGTAAAGASVAVRGTALLTRADSNNEVNATYASANVATNGTLTLQFACKFGTGNASNNATLTLASIKKVSATLFT